MLRQFYTRGFASGASPGPVPLSAHGAWKSHPAGRVPIGPRTRSVSRAEW